MAEDDRAQTPCGLVLEGAAGAGGGCGAWPEMAVGQADPRSADLDDAARAEALVELRAVVVAGDAIDRREAFQQLERDRLRPVPGMEDAVHARVDDPPHEGAGERAPEPREVRVGNERDVHPGQATGSRLLVGRCSHVLVGRGSHVLVGRVVTAPRVRDMGE